MKNEKLKAVSVYLTQEDLQGLKREARDRGLTLSQFLRSLIDDFTPYSLQPIGKRGAPSLNTNRRGW